MTTDVYNENESGHTCNFNTVGQCACGARIAWPKTSSTLPEPIVFPYVDPNSMLINMGSPVGPGFVVYERAPGEFGYDVKMARNSIGPGWRHLVQALFDAIEHDKKWNPNSGFAHMVIVQVKEKFGTLRIYWHLRFEPEKVTLRAGAFDQVEGYVDAIAAVSCKTCEACGRPGKMRRRSWVLTLCDDCDKLDRDALRGLFEQTEQIDDR